LVADTAPKEVSSLGWDELVSLKRRLSGELKELTEQIIRIDKDTMHSLTNQIKDQRSALTMRTDRLKKIRSEINDLNASLLSISEKISQSKNFLIMMEARLPSESPEALREIVNSNQILIDSKRYKSDREKSEFLSRIKEASMKLEAIKATTAIKEKYVELNQDSTNIANSIKRLEQERETLRTQMGEINSVLDNLYGSKRILMLDRESFINRYDEIAKQFDAINARLDAMSQMRKKQRAEYGYGVPDDALFRVKEQAKKKLQSGSKLSFEELKLLYGEKDQP
jgi:uncharacterized coiled-coil DUF342 family protein